MAVGEAIMLPLPVLLGIVTSVSWPGPLMLPGCWGHPEPFGHQKSQPRNPKAVFPALTVPLSTPCQPFLSDPHPIDRVFSAS